LFNIPQDRIYKLQLDELDEDTPLETLVRCDNTLWDVLTVEPTTMAGVVAVLEHVGHHEFLDDDAPSTLSRQAIGAYHVGAFCVCPAAPVVRIRRRKSDLFLVRWPDCYRRNRSRAERQEPEPSGGTWLA
jgi:hypothetical protein